MNRYGNNNRNCGNTIDSYNNEFNHCNISIPDERRQILEWISPFASRERHQAVRDSRVEKVGDWLLAIEAFLNGAHQRTGQQSLSYSVTDIRELARRI